MEDLQKYGLDLKCTMMLEDFRALQPVLEKMKEVVLGALHDVLAQNNMLVTAVEGRVKAEESLAGKLELKGEKYSCLTDITDLLGTRVITFYSDEVDKIASFAETLFEVDWDNSVDKRKAHSLDSFGYDSLHYVCRIPESLYFDEAMPELNQIRFELQMRTALQHVWATMYHDTGYKSGVEVPKEYIRQLNRLAGLLELTDEQFSSIRIAITDYRRKVQQLVQGGRFDEVSLDGDTFRSYLELKPFERLTRKIATINQAEIVTSSSFPYLKALKQLGFKTLGDVENLRKNYSEQAYQLALKQLGGTDLDIIASTIAIQNLLVVYILKSGAGELGLKLLFDMIYGESSSNADRAKRLLDTASTLSFMQK